MACLGALIIGPVMFSALMSGDPVPKLDALMEQTEAAVFSAGCDFLPQPQLGDRREVKIIYYEWKKR